MAFGLQRLDEADLLLIPNTTAHRLTRKLEVIISFADLDVQLLCGLLL